MLETKHQEWLAASNCNLCNHRENALEKRTYSLVFRSLAEGVNIIFLYNFLLLCLPLFHIEI